MAFLQSIKKKTPDDLIINGANTKINDEDYEIYVLNDTNEILLALVWTIELFVHFLFLAVHDISFSDEVLSSKDSSQETRMQEGLSRPQRNQLLRNAVL